MYLNEPSSEANHVAKCKFLPPKYILEDFVQNSDCENTERKDLNRAERDSQCNDSMPQSRIASFVANEEQLSMHTNKGALQQQRQLQIIGNGESEQLQVSPKFQSNPYIIPTFGGFVQENSIIQGIGHSGVNDATLNRRMPNLRNRAETILPNQKTTSIDKIRLFVKIRQRMQAFIRQTQTLQFKRLVPKQVSLLNDAACAQRVNGDDRCRRLWEAFIKRINRLPIFAPLSNWKFAWDAIQILIISFYFILIPLSIAFNLKLYESVFGPTLYIILASLLLLDMLIMLNTGFFQRGQLVLDRREIVKKYFHEGLLADVIAVFVIILSLINPTSNGGNSQGQEFFSYVQNFPLILFYLKWANFQHIKQRLEQRYQLNSDIENTLSLIKLFLTLIFFCHVFAALWLWIARKEEENNIQSWTEKYVSQDVNQIQSFNYELRLYVSAYYFMTVTMCTVGYGDILPVNSYEQLLSIFTIMIACGVFGYTVNEIGVVVKNYYREYQEKQQRLYVISNYMRKRSVPQELQFSIREYLEFYWSQFSESEKREEQQIIASLSKTLKEQLLVQANKQLLSKCAFFEQLFSKRILVDMPRLARQQFLIPDEGIFAQQDAGAEAALYYVERGTVQLTRRLPICGENFPTATGGRESQSFSAATNLVIKTIQKGEYFGEDEFFTGAARSYSAKSLDFTTLVIIRRHEFLALLQAQRSQTQDFERFCQQRDSLLLQKAHEAPHIVSLGNHCEACEAAQDKSASVQRDPHFIDTCATLHYTPNRERLFCRYMHQQQNEQRDKNFVRKKTMENLKRGALSFYREVKKAANLFQVRNSFIQNSDNASDESNENEVKGHSQRRHSSSSSSEQSSFEAQSSASNSDNHYYNLEVSSELHYLKGGLITQEKVAKRNSYNTVNTGQLKGDITRSVIFNNSIEDNKQAEENSDVIQQFTDEHPSKKMIQTPMQERKKPKKQTKTLKREQVEPTESESRSRKSKHNTYLNQKKDPPKNLVRQSTSKSARALPIIAELRGVNERAQFSKQSTQPTVMDSVRIDDSQYNFTPNRLKNTVLGLNRQSSHQTLQRTSKTGTVSFSFDNMGTADPNNILQSIFQPASNEQIQDNLMGTTTIIGPASYTKSKSNYSAQQQQQQGNYLNNIEDILYANFDRMKHFEYYFPEHNFEQVLLKFRRQQRELQTIGSPLVSAYPTQRKFRSLQRQSFSGRYLEVAQKHVKRRVALLQGNTLAIINEAHQHLLQTLR